MKPNLEKNLEPSLARTPKPEADEPIFCPMCNGVNAHDAIFCTYCNKALGEFRYVAEEFAAATHWHIRLADKVTNLIGRPHFLVGHIFWFALWVLINTGVFSLVRQFDQYPFGLLSLTISVEAIFITGFVLMSQTRQNDFANQRAELDYEVSVRTYRRLEEVETQLQLVSAQLAQFVQSAQSVGTKEQEGRNGTH